jgi:hypothetical protein
LRTRRLHLPRWALRISNPRPSPCKGEEEVLVRSLTCASACRLSTSEYRRCHSELLRGCHAESLSGRLPSLVRDRTFSVMIHASVTASSANVIPKMIDPLVEPAPTENQGDTIASAVRPAIVATRHRASLVSRSSRRVKRLSLRHTFHDEGAEQGEDERYGHAPLRGHPERRPPRHDQRRRPETERPNRPPATASAKTEM